MHIEQKLDIYGSNSDELRDIVPLIFILSPSGKIKDYNFGTMKKNDQGHKNVPTLVLDSAKMKNQKNYEIKSSERLTKLIVDFLSDYKYPVTEEVRNDSALKPGYRIFTIAPGEYPSFPYGFVAIQPAWAK